MCVGVLHSRKRVALFSSVEWSEIRVNDQPSSVLRCGRGCGKVESRLLNYGVTKNFIQQTKECHVPSSWIATEQRRSLLRWWCGFTASVCQYVVQHNW